MPHPDKPTGWLRLWLAIPDGAFRVAGVLFSLAILAGRVPEYADFPDVGHYWTPVVGQTPEGWPILGPRRYLPLGKMLVDLNLVLLAIAFAVRLPARTRAMRPRQIVVPLIGGFWPMLPFLAKDITTLLGLGLAEPISDALAYGHVSWARFQLGVALVTVGNLLDVWGYSTLMRSFSIVAEARDLKTTGPYRWIRHPVYAGQLIAQAGVWLVLIGPAVGWTAFYLAFVAMQLYRSWVEDHVLAGAFGSDHATWRARTWWFWR